MNKSHEKIHLFSNHKTQISNYKSQITNLLNGFLRNRVIKNLEL